MKHLLFILLTKLKWLFLIMLLIGNLSTATCQDIPTMFQQIAKLQVFIGQLEKGYQIVQKGLTLIGDIKKGDFDLHSFYFNSLYMVNPAIKGTAKVAAIIGMQVQIISNSKTWLSLFQQAGNFSPDEVTYIKSIYSNLEDLASKDIDELTQILSDGSLEMKDDERISRIDKLYDEVTEKYVFFNTFSNQVHLQSLQKNAAATEFQRLSKLFNP